MKEHKHLRDYHEAWRRLGIQSPGEVKFGDPIQFTAQVENLEHLQPPVQVPVVGLDALVLAQGAGRHSGIQATAGGRGIWIELVYERQGQLAVVVYPAAAGATVVAAIPAANTSRSGPPSVTGLATIHIATAAIPANVMNLRGNETRPLPGVFIGPGERFQIVQANANAIFIGGFIYREVPARGPAPTP